MPQGTFVERWVNYAKDRTEAPEAFHKYMAYMAVATSLGRRAWMNWSGGRFFPNMYFVTISESASYKSTALNMIKRVIRRVDPTIITPDDFTDAGLNMIFQKYNEGLIPVDEFSKILKASDGHFGQIKGILTSVYDCPEEYRLPYRVKKDTGDRDSVEFPVFSIAAATTGDSVVRNMDLEDMNGGFMTRFFIICGSDSDKSVSIPEGDDEVAITEFANSLRRLRDANFLDPAKPVKVSQNARDVRKPWYDEIKRLMRDDPSYSELSGAINRLRNYALKFAILECIIRGHEEHGHYVIQPDDMVKGIEIANEGIGNLFNSMGDLESMSSKDRNIQTVAKIRVILKKFPSIQKGDLYRRIRGLTTRDLKPAIDTLVDSGEIRVKQSPNGAILIERKNV